MADDRGPRPPLDPAQARQLALDAGARTIVLVEGWSDQGAVDTLALRRGCDLAGERILVMPIGGVTNLGSFIQALGPAGLGLKLVGLCDVAEEGYTKRVLERSGLGTHLTRTGMEAIGFFVCDADLEDELIRAVGAVGVEAVLETEGELESFRRFQAQPAQRGRSLQPQLRRFMGTRAGRKIRYGRLLTEVVDLERVPRALALVLAHAREV